MVTKSPIISLKAHIVSRSFIDDKSTFQYYNYEAFNRGALSADTLRSLGYTNAKFIAGGLGAYRKLA